MLKKSRWYFLLITLCCFALPDGEAANKRYRCMWRDDPATTMVIGWDQVSGQNAVLCYDEVDFGRQASAYRNKKRPDRIIQSKGMDNHFVRLTGLKPNTVYYFVILDNEGVSQRLSFKTMPDDPNVPLSIIAGGDSRNNREVRRNANQLVSRLRPHFVVFAGDMTGGDTNENWRDWFDDWQYTIGSDGRLFPIVPARGNHERENGSITELFDVPNIDAYYALTFGGSLFRLYTLNSLISPSGKQRIWLERDLNANQGVTWKMAQYHHGMRPHTRRKAPRDDLYANWAKIFHDQKVSLVLESDAHVVKTTYPISPGPNGDDGFIRDDKNGTIYIGEGCWGAPLRSNDNPRAWTRASGSFNQFKWIFVRQQDIEVRTVKTENVTYVREVSDDDIFRIPVGLHLWKPPSGDVLTIKNKNYTPPPPPSSIAERSNTVPPSKGSPPRQNRPSKAPPTVQVPLLTTDAQGILQFKYDLPQPGTVSIILTQKLDNGKLAVKSKRELTNQRAGESIQRLDLVGVKPGEYMLIIKARGKLLKRYRVRR